MTDRELRELFEEQTALDRYWDVLVDGTAAPAAPERLDPSLAVTVRAVHRSAAVPGPSPAFVARLEADMFASADPPITPSGPLDSSPLSVAVGERAISPRPAVERNAGRSLWRQGLELGAVAALLVAILGGMLVGLRVLPIPDGGGPLAMPAVFGDRDDAETTPTLRWKAAIADGEGGFTARPVVAGDLVVTAGYTVAAARDTIDEEVLLAYDLATGTERWRLAASTMGGSQFGLPVVADGSLYATLSPPWHDDPRDPISPTVAAERPGSVLLGIDARTGQERWRAPIADPEYAPPIVAEGNVFLQASDGAIVAYDAATGAARWRVQSPATGPEIDRPRHVTLAATDGMLVVSARRVLLGLDAATGDERWRLATTNDGWDRVVAGEGLVYQFADVGPGAEGDIVGRIRAIAVADGTVRWEQEVSGINGTPLDPLLASGMLIFRDPTNEPTIIALDAATGDERWRREFAGHVPLPPTASDGVLHAANELPGLFDLGFAFLGAKDRIVALDLATGDILWHLDPGSNNGQVSEIAAADGLVLFHNYGHEPGATGTLFAYDAPRER